MPLRDVELRHLHALQAVAAERSFGRAAGRLGYTQSAVSQQIATLEKAIGGALFDRPGGPKPVVITPLGEVLLEHATLVLDKVEEAERAIQDHQTGVIGALSVGTFQSVSVQVLPNVLRRFKNARPHVDVRLFEADEQEELEERLADGRLDLAFLVRPIMLAGIEAVDLFTDPFMALSPRDEPLEAGPSSIEVAAFDRVPLISQHDTACQRLIDDGLRDTGIELNVVFRSADNSAVQAMVRAGMGHAVMPALAIDEDDPGVLIRSMSPGIPERVICLGRPIGRTLPPAADTFATFAAECFAERSAASALIGASSH
jgi:DNA-binding transcriptional LysR family regulator